MFLLEIIIASARARAVIIAVAAFVAIIIVIVASMQRYIYDCAVFVTKSLVNK